jgi:hypothetical protein
LYFLAEILPYSFSCCVAYMTLFTSAVLPTLNDFAKHHEIHAIFSEGVCDHPTLTAILQDVLGFSSENLAHLNLFKQPSHATESINASTTSITSNLPVSVWLAPMEPETRNWLVHCALSMGVVVEHSGSAPSDTALVICSPLGQDVSSQVLLHQLPAARTVGLDGFFPLDNLKRLTLMANPATHLDSLSTAAALLSTSNKSVSVIRDSAGFIVQRVVVSNIALACELAQQGFMSPADIDTALLALNMGYSQGLLALGDKLGTSRVAQTLAALNSTTGNQNYRPALWLQRRAQLNMSLLEAGI